MKNTIKTYVFLLAASGLTFSGLVAQQKDKNSTTFVQPKSIIELNTGNTTQSKSYQNQVTDNESLFKTYLKLAKGNTHVLIETETDALGFTHEKCKQVYRGVDVEYGVATISRKNGRAVSIHGEYYYVNNVAIQPTITTNQALQKAIARVGAKKYLWEDAIAS